MIEQRQELNVGDGLKLVSTMMQQQQFADAACVLEAIHRVEPHDTGPLQLLGVCYAELKRHQEAIFCFDKAGEILRAELIACALNRGKSLGELGRDVEALAIYDNVLHSDPNNYIAVYNRGLLLMQTNQYLAARAELARVLQLAPDYHPAKFALGFCNLVLGNYRDGFGGYEWRLKDPIVEPDAPLWDGTQDISGKTVLVHGDQGLGDNIMFARYLPVLVGRGASVLVWVPAALKPLFINIPGVGVLADDRAGWPRLDYWCRFMSLAYCCRTDNEDSIPPPLNPQIEVGHGWRMRVERGTEVHPGNGQGEEAFRVGLCWTGSLRSRYDAYRSVPLAVLLPLCAITGVKLYSLQLGVRDADREALRGSPIVDFTEHIHDFSDTVQLMSMMDMIVTVDTSVAHMAGTLSVPTLVMLSAFRAYWLWVQGREDSPWYPSVQVIKQARPLDWSDVVGKVALKVRKTAWPRLRSQYGAGSQVYSGHGGMRRALFTQ
jgi:hypothetical protein